MLERRIRPPVDSSGRVLQAVYTGTGPANSVIIMREQWPFRRRSGTICVPSPVQSCRFAICVDDLTIAISAILIARGSRMIGELAFFLRFFSETCQDSVIDPRQDTVQIVQARILPIIPDLPHSVHLSMIYFNFLEFIERANLIWFLYISLGSSRRSVISPMLVLQRNF